MSNYGIKELIERYPVLSVCEKDIAAAYFVLEECFYSGHKLLIAGNGGSCSDADHIVGELMKGFKKPRRIKADLRNKLTIIDPSTGGELADKLQMGLPAIALHNHAALNTAFLNDVENGGDLFYAQQVLGYGKPGDVLLGISTSGNAKDVYYASIIAKAKDIRVIGLTGKTGGSLKKVSDVAVVVPSNETFEIQELHLPVYHCWCLMLEKRFF